jgi:hypothetical protein
MGQMHRDHARAGWARVACRHLFGVARGGANMQSKGDSNGVSNRIFPSWPMVPDDKSSRQVFKTSLQDKSSRQVFKTSLQDKSSRQVLQGIACRVLSASIE